MKEEKEYIARVRKNIKKLRLKRGLSFVELATACEMEKQHIYRAETGIGNKDSAPTLKTLIKIATGLGVDLVELFKP
jgi:transcriptional regulator with XRE-family HTH domain